MHFPLLRLLSFWLGLPLLLFLSWAWGDSMHHGSAIFIPTSNFEISIGSQRGSVGCAFTRDLGNSVRNPGGGFIPLTKPTIYRDALSEWINPPGAWDSPAITTESPVGGVSLLAFAWWFVTLLYLIAWPGLMIWRLRRMSQLKASAA